ncbi:phycobilisome rod-core linker polypeptide [Synechococcus sp. PCC 7336]|uniref:phycobilisome rod-core linker polypeptide n=1 Tax=Synechococcus sp. PCC 7336 TaxID=195250 RepID=UPI00034DAB1A|nr:phycobilisome rod-core linker polypeptide [Synechococcus sp. PCC 7336]
MPLPLLSYQSSTQNARVLGYDVPGDDRPKVYSTENLLSAGDVGELIEAAYRQIFFHAFKCDREPCLESQLRSGQITVREFVRGLLLSNTYRKSFYDLNSNYRFVEQTVQRVLGRDVYGETERIAWSIVVATKGIVGFVDALLSSEEYLENFGDDVLPYQRRRVLPGRAKGELPFNIKSPRYNEYHRDFLGFPQFIMTYASRPKRAFRGETLTRAGDPASYLDMAKKIGLPTNSLRGVSASDFGDYMRKVPSRK